MDETSEFYTIPEFCAVHHMGRTFYYKLKKQGLAPLELRIGHKVLIAKKSVASWRAAMTAKTAKAAKAAKAS